MSGTEQTERDSITAYFDLHRGHERLLADLVGLRDAYRASAALHDSLGPGDEPFQHAAWANRADDLDRILGTAPSPASPAETREGQEAAFELAMRYLPSIHPDTFIAAARRYNEGGDVAFSDSLIVAIQAEAPRIVRAVLASPAASLPGERGDLAANHPYPVNEWDAYREAYARWEEYQARGGWSDPPGPPASSVGQER